MLENLKSWVAQENLDPLGQWDDYDYLRFCRARKFQLVEIKSMFKKFITYRTDHNVDSLLQDFSFPDLEEVRKFFPHCYHGIDKTGRPVRIERMGTLDTESLQKVVTYSKLEEYIRYAYEVQMKLRLPICSELAGRRIETIVTIQDLTGASM